MQSLPDMIAEAQNILTDYFTDMDGPYTSLNKHAGFLKSLSKQAIRDMPLESVFIAFSYLKYYVIRQAQKRGPYTEQHHNHPLFGDIEYRAVDETAFPAEIKILKSLQTRMDYSSRLKNAIRKTAQEAFEDFTQRDTFMKDIDRWPNIRRKKQRITGGSFLVIFNMAAAESFNLPYEHPAFSILPRYDRNLSFSMGHIGPDYAENREPDIRWNPSPLSITDPAYFLSTAAHEKVHDILYQLGLFHYRGDPLPKTLKQDAEKSILRRKYYVGGFLTDIQSVCFSDPEEKLCMEIQHAVSQKLETLIKKRADSKAQSHPQKIRPEP